LQNGTVLCAEGHSIAPKIHPCLEHLLATKNAMLRQIAVLAAFVDNITAKAVSAVLLLSVLRNLVVRLQNLLFREKESFSKMFSDKKKVLLLCDE